MQKKYTPPPFTSTYLVDFSSPIIPFSLYFKGSILPHPASSPSSSFSSSSSSSPPSSPFSLHPPSSFLLSPSSISHSPTSSLPLSSTLLVKRIPSFSFSNSSLPPPPSSLPPPPSSLIFIQKDHLLQLLNYYFDDENKELLLFYSLPNQLSLSKIIEEGLCTEGILYFFKQIISLLFSLQKEDGRRGKKEEREGKHKKEEAEGEERGEVGRGEGGEGEEKTKKGESEKIKEREHIRGREKNKDEGWDFNPKNLFLSNYQIKACFYMRGEWEEIMISPESFYLSSTDIDKEKEIIFILGLYFYYLIFARIPFVGEINEFKGNKRKKAKSEEQEKELDKKMKRYSKERVIKFYEECLEDLVEKINKEVFLTFPKNQLIEIFRKLLHPDPSQRYSKRNLLEDPIWKIDERQNEKEKEKENEKKWEKVDYGRGKIEKHANMKREREEKKGEKPFKPEEEESKEKNGGSIIFNERMLKIFEKEDKKVRREGQGRSYVTKNAIEFYETILSEIKFCEISLRIITELEKAKDKNNESIILPLVYYTAKTSYYRLVSLNHSLLRAKNKMNPLLILSQIKILPIIKQKISSLLTLLSSNLDSFSKTFENKEEIDLGQSNVFGPTFKQDHFEALKKFYQQKKNWSVRLMDDLLILGAWENLKQNMEINQMIDEKEEEKEKANQKKRKENEEKEEKKKGEDGKDEKKGKDKEKNQKIKQKTKNEEEKKVNIEKKEKREEVKEEDDKFKGEEEKNEKQKEEDNEKEEEDKEEESEKEEQSKVRMIEFYEELRGKKSEERIGKKEKIKTEKGQNNERETVEDYQKREEELTMRVDFGIKQVFGELF